MHLLNRSTPPFNLGPSPRRRKHSNASFHVVAPEQKTRPLSRVVVSSRRRRSSASFRVVAPPPDALERLASVRISTDGCRSPCRAAPRRFELGAAPEFRGVELRAVRVGANSRVKGCAEPDSSRVEAAVSASRKKRSIWRSPQPHRLRVTNSHCSAAQWRSKARIASTTCSPETPLPTTTSRARRFERHSLGRPSHRREDVACEAAR